MTAQQSPAAAARARRGAAGDRHVKSAPGSGQDLVKGSADRRQAAHSGGAKGAPPAPPDSDEAERALLGALLIDPDAFGQLAGRLDRNVFYRPQNAAVYQALVKVHGRGETPDVVTVSSVLEELGTLDQAGGVAYLADLANAVPSALNAEAYLRIVHDRARARLMLRTAELWARAAHSEGDARTKLVNQALALECEIAAEDSAGWTLYTLEDAFAPRPPIADIVEGLLRPSMLAVLYGAPNTLKSMLLLDLCLAVASGRQWLLPLPGRVEPQGRQTARLPVLWIDADNGVARTHERVEAVSRSHGLEPGAVAFYYASMPSPPFDASDLASTDALIQRRTQLRVGLLVIDNLGTVSGKADENSAEMATVMANLRRVAEETRAAVVVVHHQRKTTGARVRSGETLRGHSSIEASLDLALLVEREDGADCITVKATKSRGPRVAPIGAQFAFDRREDSSDLALARFHGLPLEDNSRAGRARRAVVQAALAAPRPLNKSELKQAAKEYDEELGDRLLRAAIDRLVADGRLAVSAGAHNAQLYTLSKTEVRGIRVWQFG